MIQIIESFFLTEIFYIIVNKISNFLKISSSKRRLSRLPRPHVTAPRHPPHFGQNSKNKSIHRCQLISGCYVQISAYYFHPTPLDPSLSSPLNSDNPFNGISKVMIYGFQLIQERSIWTSANYFYPILLELSPLQYPQ